MYITQQEIEKKCKENNIRLDGSLVNSKGEHFLKYLGVFWARCGEYGDHACMESRTGFLVDKETAHTGFETIEALIAYVVAEFPDHIRKNHKTIIIAPLTKD